MAIFENPFGTPVLADGFQYALKESTWPGIIVCIILMVLSCFSWAVMVTKIRVLRKAKKQSALFLSIFRQSATPLQVYAEEKSFQGSPLYAVYLSGCRELSFHLLGSPEVDDTFKSRLDNASQLSPPQMERVTVAMERMVGEMVLKLESQMALLATAVSGAPFLGLLGTVWGVMDTFGGVAAAEGAASIKTMAPGVSAALVTTVVGLLVAIPAMFGYNFLVNNIKAMVVRLDNFAAEFSSAVGRKYISYTPRTPAPGQPTSAPARPPQTASPVEKSERTSPIEVEATFVPSPQT